MSAQDAVGHLIGLQAQNVKPPYYALAARLDEGNAAEIVKIVTRRYTRVLRTLSEYDKDGYSKILQ